MWVARGGEGGDPQGGPMTWVPPACAHRRLMDINTFEENFRDKKRKTYLCYKVEVREGDPWTPVLEHWDYLRNQGADTPWLPRHHAELCFLDLFPSWPLDQEKQYRLTWYISWSPCPDCVPELVEFLKKNSHVSLRIFAAHVYTYIHGLRDLRDAGAQLAIMTRNELQDCWDTFVDSQGQPFEPWPNMDEHIQEESQQLQTILRNPEN
ncbi:DNA dC-_dU-editing enzyme APOBEC-3G isoform X1 [Pipistrellus kuhlii]|uniref:DNA dC->dU-editing enzyme APOBEC-3G isoform X1 n=1 Tax=Pipistrellus kuhlii TaxID=59472 RepID=UPI00174ECF41|nr:DNA dC->dU-editing enzyme APOBEC-3G isoform X1 [Pipistrellus kuhlii]